MMRVTTSLAILLLAAACSSDTGGTDCAWVRPILTSAGDRLTLETEVAIAGHNLAWERVCRPPPDD